MPSLFYLSHADSQDITVLGITPQRTLSVRQNVAHAGAAGASVFHPRQPWLYGVRRSGDWALVAYAVGEGGRLTFDHALALPLRGVYVSVSACGRWLWCASYHDDALCVIALDERGRLRAVEQVLAAATKLHAVVPSPAGGWVVASSLGSDRLLMWRWSDPICRLHTMPNHVHTLPMNTGPRHLRFHPLYPAVPWLFCVGELSGTVEVLHMDVATGACTPVQTITLMPQAWDAARDGAPWGAELHITPDGRQLYASERRSNTLLHFVVGLPGAMAPALALREQVATEIGPRGFATVTHEGHTWLLVAGQTSDHARLYLHETGQSLICMDRCVIGQGCNWVTAGV